MTSKMFTFLELYLIIVFSQFLHLELFSTVYLVFVIKLNFS